MADDQRDSPLTLLGEAARDAWTDYLQRFPDPGDEVWEVVVRAVFTAMLNPEALTAHKLGRAGQLIAAAVLKNAGEDRLADEITNGCLAVHPGEPFFTLRGQDRLAPIAIRAWITEAERANTPEHKLDQARDVLEEFGRWGGDRKHPD